ncbi:hypothetical protein [Flavobacterium sp. GT3R68]|uniref:hypothetical protein n=1 Tax=Flavobacterium sp. GT3R68 TaxID=2594437 RepID=UPI000F8670F8|nr:hypothetical protein [Flavobacterium sp. GT3R68]RTY92431.1 hypothetical protein EKL32_16630 [Flavobacterium sp. GSN2]TRW94055.1 hypothetical protein FNW07_03845 [Flavobacterium sp. GT3R68]
MSYLKYTPYAYLLFAVIFIFDGISKLNAGNDTPWLSFMIAGLGVFMFFFRRNYFKKIENRNPKK